MESTDTVLLVSPGSIAVALVTIAFLLHRAWPRLFPRKSDKIIETVPAGLYNPAGLAVSKEPELPEGWWTGQEVFELERRALFSKTWLYLAHSTQFKKPGAYQSFDIAGFPVFLIRGKDDKIRAFHNVCRHRAYTITRKETGASTVLGCRYHGWSYDTTGRLVKAPQFDDIPGFDKSRNSLFEIHTHTTDQGLVFVNLDSGEPAAFDSTITSSVGRFARIAGMEEKSTWITGQTLSGDFNWKVGANGYHPDEFLRELNRRASEVSRHSLATRLVRSIMQKSTGNDCSLFPTTLLCSLEDGDLTVALSFFPASESKTHMRYDLFARSSVSEPETQRFSDILQSTTKQLAGELEVKYQYISKTQSSSGESNSTATREILRRLQDHMKLERIEGSQIFPATHKPEGSTLFQQADQLCKELDCASGGSQTGTSTGPLDW
ncbi:hypothetical protein N7457_006586 [Penicillium paradoxum]|uniref:uncharacterized protein n=1 Tax=Penicillium paradoxum TaxID=176176 RepID=UPI0025472049|nr:uncharacterized protein N7457_006586 [Penicillium paradoxum]KAJ5778866.1 hypothetical protein N7457_006586 [Penicillium paradoxum]